MKKPTTWGVLRDIIALYVESILMPPAPQSEHTILRIAHPENPLRPLVSMAGVC